MLKFIKSHEWAKIEADKAVIGISDYAQKELGDIVFVELPKMGDNVKQGARFGTVESTKAASELYAPLSGEVIGINTDLINNPQWINEDPLGKGWMIKIKMSNNAESSGLMDEKAYGNFIAEEK